jgi:hypothetical protein
MTMTATAGIYGSSLSRVYHIGNFTFTFKCETL